MSVTGDTLGLSQAELEAAMHLNFTPDASSSGYWSRLAEIRRLPRVWPSNETVSSEVRLKKLSDFGTAFSSSDAAIRRLMQFLHDEEVAFVDKCALLRGISAVAKNLPTLVESMEMAECTARSRMLVFLTLLQQSADPVLTYSERVLDLLAGSIASVLVEGGKDQDAPVAVRILYRISPSMSFALRVRSEFLSKAMNIALSHNQDTDGEQQLLAAFLTFNVLFASDGVPPLLNWIGASTKNEITLIRKGHPDERGFPHHDKLDQFERNRPRSCSCMLKFLITGRVNVAI